MLIAAVGLSWAVLALPCVVEAVAHEAQISPRRKADGFVCAALLSLTAAPLIVAVPAGSAVPYGVLGAAFGWAAYGFMVLVAGQNYFEGHVAAAMTVALTCILLAGF